MDLFGISQEQMEEAESWEDYELRFAQDKDNGVGLWLTAGLQARIIDAIVYKKPCLRVSFSFKKTLFLDTAGFVKKCESYIPRNVGLVVGLPEVLAGVSVPSTGWNHGLALLAVPRQFTKRPTKYTSFGRLVPGTNAGSA